MGTRALINQVGQKAYKPFVRPLRDTHGLEPSDRAANRGVRWGIDVPLLLFTVSLVVFGLLMVYSASWDFSYRMTKNPMYNFHRQLIWVALGSLIAIVTTWLDYHFWSRGRIAVYAMIVTILSLLAVLITQNDRMGAFRTIFGGSVQPSELTKFMLVIYLSLWLYNRRDQLQDVWLGLVPLGMILGFIGIFIILQPDLSAVLTIVLLGGLLFFLAGGDLRQILILLLVGFLVGYLILASGLFPNGMQRINDFIAGLQDPIRSSEHVRRSLEAFISGGVWGVGIGKSQTKVTGLPFPHTDSIFAVIGEETGVIGSIFLVLAYVGLMWRGLAISARAPDFLGRLMAAGLTSWIAIEAFINMCVMVGLMPFAGNALPFISYGGSSMVMCLTAVGMLQNISRQAERVRITEESSYNAVVDLRGRDRRRRVSRPSRSSSVIPRK